MEFNVGADQVGGEFGVCCSTGSGTPYRRRYVMDFLAVLHVHKR